MADTEFTAEDLRMIKAMCTSANPQYPERDMYPAWQHVYEVASNQLKIMTAPIRCEAWCSQHPSCQHDWSSWKPVTAPVEPVQVLCGPDGQWSITGLSEDDLGALAGGLMSTMDQATSEIRTEERLSKILYDALPD